MCMPNLEQKVNEWIGYTFLGEKLMHNFPYWLDNSQILSDEIVNMINNFFPYRLNASYAHLIYSTSESGFNFMDLAARLKIVNGQFMILIKAKPKIQEKNINSIKLYRKTRKEETGKTQKSHIFGAFCSVAVVDGYNYFGDDKCFLFSVLPDLRVYFPREGGSSNFIYFQSKKLNTSQISTEGSSIGGLVNKLGLGFGGISPAHCRIWIDYNMKNRSKFRSDKDETYAPGPFIPGDSGHSEVNFFLINLRLKKLKSGLLIMMERIQNFKRN